VDSRRRAIVEVDAEVHKELWKLTLLNDLKINELTNALLAKCPQRRRTRQSGA
jgi:hypothetical protein